MSVLTDTQLTTEANIIKNETAVGANTATRVGQMVIDLIDSKPNISAAPITVKVSLSSAQILALNTTPITLVSAQGVGKIIKPILIMYKFNFVSAAYAGSTNLYGFYNTLSGTATGVNGIITETASSFSTSLPTPNTPIVGDISNQDFNLSAQGGNPTTGDGTLDVYLTYIIVTL